MSDELKTPWRVDDFSCIWDNDGTPIADFALYRDAAAIVHRVNCHDRLVEALEEVRRESRRIPLYALGPEMERAFSDVEDALELAKGGSHD